MMRVFALALPAAFAVGVLVAACSNSGFAPYCTGIPAGGCLYAASADGATNCSSDPTCAALYTSSATCAWTLVQKCPMDLPPTDAGAPRDGSADTRDAEAGFQLDAYLRDAGFVVPSGAGGGPGCEDLEFPDCSLDEALACGEGCCGCADLYVCADGGWNDWGDCDDAGAIVPYEY